MKIDSEFLLALDELENEKGIKKEIVLDALEAALISAYKRNFGASQNARVEIDQNTGNLTVYAELEVVDEVFDNTFEISLEDARKINPAYEIGDTLEKAVEPASFGRIAAQTAKQVVVQKIREAERGVVFEQFADKEGELMSAVIERQEKNCYHVELGKAFGILPLKETIPGETYETGKRLKVYVLEVKRAAKGPQIVTSRSHPGLVKRLFELEVPEIASNAVLIKSLAREAGQRSKIAVYAEDENVDPVGACVGPRGQRIESVVEELGGERIDVIPWSADPAEYISNSLRPAKVVLCQVKEEHAAKVIVPDYQLSLAIGKEGQNARLAAKLTGYKIDIKSQSQVVENVFAEAQETHSNNVIEEKNETLQQADMEIDNAVDKAEIEETSED